jgi:hypothetical protein
MHGRRQELLPAVSAVTTWAPAAAATPRAAVVHTVATVIMLRVRMPAVRWRASRWLPLPVRDHPSSVSAAPDSSPDAR